MPKVYNKNRPHPSDAVLVDRTTIFGNKFKIGTHGSREEVIDKYEEWIFQPEQVSLRLLMIHVLRDRDLLCHCAPEECHADIILKIANAPWP